MCVKCLVLYLFKDVPTYFVFFINFYFQYLAQIGFMIIIIRRLYPSILKLHESITTSCLSIISRHVNKSYVILDDMSINYVTSCLCNLSTTLMVSWTPRKKRFYL